jgi:regulator of sirC expression with transglutaminase-like and TPR domain
MNRKNDETMLMALLKLLDDPDPEVYTQIENKVVEIGPSALPFLMDVSVKNSDNLAASRIDTLVQKIRFNKTLNALTLWQKKADKNIMEAAFILAEYHHMHLNTQMIYEQIEKLKRDIWLELNEDFTALEKIHILNHVLFKIYRFTGNKTNIGRPENSLISDLMAKKQGNSVILAILYQELAQSLKLPVQGVNLPENFVLAYLKTDQLLSSSNVLFYINPFNNGIVFTKEDIHFFIKQMNLDSEKDFFEPCLPEKTIIRLLHELKQSYELMGQQNNKNDMNELIKLLT